MRRFEGEQAKDLVMKAIAILPAAAAALMMLGVSVASSQEVCLKGYQTCMDTCGSRPTAQMQDTCIQNCQTQNNACSDRVFGNRNGAVVNAPAAAQAPAPAAKDAMAKKEPRGKKGQKKEEAKAPAVEPQQEQPPAAEQEQAPAR
jgi:hypothetical protein